MPTPGKQSIVTEYKKLVSEKLKGGLAADHAESLSRLQIEHNYGKKEADAALSCVLSESAEAARRSSPFAEFGKKDVPLATSNQESVTQKEITLPPNFRRLVMEKRKAGLTREQAERIIRAQLEHDAQLAEADSDTAATDKEKKKPAKA